MKTNSWKMPVYGASVQWYDNRIVMHNDLAKMTNDQMPDLAGYDGIMQYMTNESNRAIYVVGVFNKSVCTLAHECIHLSIDVLERHGIKTTCDNDEPLTYLVETCMAEFMRKHKVK